MSAASTRARAREAFRQLRLAIVLLVVPLTVFAAPAAGQFVSLAPVAAPAPGGNSVTVSVTFGGEFGAYADYECRSRDDYQGACSDPWYYYEEYDYAPARGALQFTVNGVRQDGLLQISDPADACTPSGAYGAFSCTRTYTATGTVTLPAGVTSALTAQLAAPLDWAWQTQTVTVGPATHLAPAVSLAPHAGDNRDAARCFRDCFEGTAVIATPAYVSRDIGRSVALAYRSDRARGRGQVVLEVSDVSSATAPERITFRLQRKSDGTWVTFHNGLTELVFDPQGRRTVRIVGVFEDFATDAHAFDAVVTNTWDGGAVRRATTVPVVALVETAAQSPYGVGWQVAGVRRIRGWAGTSAGAVLTDGNGTVQLFRGGCANTDGAWSGCRWDGPAGEPSYLESAPSGLGATYRQVFPDGASAGFDIQGRQVYAADRLGERTRFFWKDAERLDSVMDPAGKAIRFVWDYRGSVAQIVDPMGRTTYLDLDAAGDLRAMTDLVPQQSVFVYQQHRLIARVAYNVRGDRSDYTYDPLGRLMTIQGPAIPTVQGTWQRPASNFQTPEWRMAGVFGGQGTWAAPYVSPTLDNLPAIVADAAGRTMWHYVDRFGQPLALVDPVAWRVLSQTWYNDHGNPVRTVGPRADTTVATWSAARPWQLDSKFDAATKMGVAYTYGGPYGDLTQVRMNGKERDSLAYDASGRLWKARTGGPGQGWTVYAYEGNTAGPGRPTSITEPRGHTTALGYEPGGLGNALSTTSAGATRTVVRDAVGRDSVTIDATGRRTTTRYDVLNRVVAVTDPAGQTTTTAYDDATGAVTVTDAVGQRYVDSTNALGLEAARGDPQGLIARALYDGAGQVAMTSNMRGQVLSYGYHAQTGLLTHLYTPDGHNHNYGVDALGRWAAAGNAEVQDTAFTDLAGRDSVVVRHFAALPGLRFTVTSRYDSLGRRVLRTLNRAGAGPSGRAFPAMETRYRYNADGTLQEVGLAEGGSLAAGDVDFTYNDEGAPSSMRMRNGVDLLNGLTALHTLGSQRYTKRFSPGDGSLDFQFGRVLGQDKTGRVVRRYSPDMMAAREFAYDAAGRLVGDTLKSASQSGCVGTPGPGEVAGDAPTSHTCTSTLSPTGILTAWSWDAVGNPTMPAWGVEAGTGNQLWWYGSMRHLYDPDGNLLARKSHDAGYATAQRLSWNSLGQLVGVWNNPNLAGPGGLLSDSVAFGYDASGARVRKTVVGADGALKKRTYYVWDSGELLAELDGAGDLMAHYAHHPGGVDAPLMATAFDAAAGTRRTYYYVREAPGHVVGLLDENGAVAAQYTGRFGYAPFGSGVAGAPLHGGWRNPLQFGAREFDAETGLYYNRARYYDPALGRFISQDPIGLAGGINLYAYTGNDPVNLRDPTGLDSGCDSGYWMWSQTHQGGYSSERTWTYFPNFIACGPADPGTPAAPRVTPGSGGSTNPRPRPRAAPSSQNSCQQNLANAAVAVSATLGGRQQVSTVLPPGAVRLPELVGGMRPTLYAPLPTELHMSSNGTAIGVGARGAVFVGGLPKETIFQKYIPLMVRNASRWYPPLMAARYLFFDSDPHVTEAGINLATGEWQAKGAWFVVPFNRAGNLCGP